ncbi:peptide/nickel transport system substrate-binding protein [Arthrobacter sp. CAN_A6]|uniref:ABC transporter substrate-binding protein n=1 Tax=Arthrobacter sp. CAN_A6 TaxID=2787721 RepID=UPI001A27B199
MKNNAPGLKPLKRACLTLTAMASVLGMAACTSASPAPTSSSAPPTSAATPTAGNTTFVLGTAADPESLDPAMVSDTESYRVTQQMLQGLVGVDPLTSEPAPLLASSWEERDEGRAYAFELRDDVIFHDGEPFNAEAVCANFDRWYTTPRSARAASTALPFEDVFKAYSDEPEVSLYSACQPLGQFEVLISLKSRMTGFIPALASPGFAMSSPKALTELAADELTGTREGTRISEYGRNPVGTGPFRFTSWEDDRVELSFFEEYWGERGEVRDVIFTTIAHPDARLRALIAGRIDGYDFVTVENAGEVARAGLQFLQRDPYSVLYLGMNQNFPGIDDIKFRQAVAYAVDKPELISGRFLEGTKPARLFIPEKLGISGETVESYGHNLDRAKELLAESGYDGSELPFYYPLDISRPYLPAPEKTYAELSRQLTAAGLNLKPMPTQWNEGYVDVVMNEDARAFHLLGWSGTYQDPDNFVGAIFGSYSNELAFEDNQLFSKINRARTLPNGDERRESYADISSQVAARVPAVPLAFPISALAMAPRVVSYPVSPVMNEVFNRIDLADVQPDTTP